MPVRYNAFSSTSTRIENVLASEVYIGHPFSSHDIPAGQLNPDAQCAKKYTALWDTGATNSVLSKKVVEQCGFTPITLREVHHAGGRSVCPVFLVSLWLPNQFVIQQISMTQGAISGGIDVLIGMDVIQRGDFAVTNYQGKTSFSFRIPSFERIDFNDDKYNPTAPVHALPRVGRNDPCPCKSGKKYKHCCMDKTA